MLLLLLFLLSLFFADVLLVTVVLVPPVFTQLTTFLLFPSCFVDSHRLAVAAEDVGVAEHGLLTILEDLQMLTFGGALDLGVGVRLEITNTNADADMLLAFDVIKVENVLGRPMADRLDADAIKSTTATPGSRRIIASPEVIDLGRAARKLVGGER